MRTTFALLLTLLVLSGCGSVLSEGVRSGVDRKLTLPMVQSNPDEFKGRKVVWGGIIVSSDNLEQVSEIEVLETGLTGRDVPGDGESRGRFLIQTKKYLDTSVYKPDKRVTVAGIVEGVEVRKIGKMDYPYPVISPLEIKLSEPIPMYGYDDYPTPYHHPFYGPFGPRYPFGPFGPYPYPYGPYPYNYPYPYYWP